MSSKETAIIEYESEFNSTNELWLRVTAFLSLKSLNTQRTYASVISEWCNYLGAEAGTEKASKLLINASDISAVAYRSSLEKKEGQKPRYETSAAKTNSKALQKQGSFRSKRDGMQSTLANATIRKKIAALRRIYRMLLAADLGVKINPFDTDRIPPPSAMSGQKRPTEMVDVKLVSKIISNPNELTDKGLRDKTILAILFGGGLRRSEVVSLRMADVKNTTRGTTYLNLRATKSKRDFDQAIPRWTADILTKLTTLRKKQGAKSGDFLFISYRGKGGNIPTNTPLSDSGVYKLFKYYCIKAGAGKFVTPHSARATAITKLLEDGMSHREVQEFSRHASVQMVEVYDKRRISVDQNAAKDLKYD